MRKFGDIYKGQQTKFESLKEGKVLEDFKSIYNTLLEKYNINEFYDLNEKYQEVFIAELNSYWSEEQGINERGEKFLQKKSDMLGESSTTLQKKNYLKKKSFAVINETFRQSELKWKLYNVIDEMYKEIKASEISEVLSTDIISEVIHESFNDSLSQFIKEISFELNESSKDKKKRPNS